MLFVIYFLIIATAFSYKLKILEGLALQPAKINGNDKLLKSRSTDPLRANYYGILLGRGMPFMIQRKKWYHRVLRNLGISEDICTGESKFDQRFSFITDTPDCLKTLLEKQPLRNQLEQLFSLPVKALHATETKLWVQMDLLKWGFFYQGNRTIAHETCYECLSAIAKAIHDSDIALPQKTCRNTPRRIALISMSFHFAFFIVLVVGAFPAGLMMDNALIVEGNNPFKIAFITGTILAALWILMLCILLRKSSWLSLSLADFAAFGYIGLLSLTLFSTQNINITLDKAVPQIIYAPIDRMECTLHCGDHYPSRWGKVGIQYYPTLEQCYKAIETLKQYEQKDRACANSSRFSFLLHFFTENSQPGIKKFVTYPEFVAVRPGDTYSVPVHPGTLGLRWVKPEEITPYHSE